MDRVGNRRKAVRKLGAHDVPQVSGNGGNAGGTQPIKYVRFVRYQYVILNMPFAVFAILAYPFKLFALPSKAAGRGLLAAT